MLLLHFFTPKIAHSSHILAGNQTCAIVDPRRTVQVYIDAARSFGVRITHVPVADYRTRYSEFAPDSPIALICSDGHRASLGASILKQHGFTRVTNVAGGMTGYLAAGLPTKL